jgi:hypothetical protein
MTEGLSIMIDHFVYFNTFLNFLFSLVIFVCALPILVLVLLATIKNFNRLYLFTFLTVLGYELFSAYVGWLFWNDLHLYPASDRMLMIIRGYQAVVTAGMIVAFLSMRRKGVSHPAVTNLINSSGKPLVATKDPHE